MAQDLAGLEGVEHMLMDDVPSLCFQDVKEHDAPRCSSSRIQSSGPTLNAENQFRQTKLSVPWTSPGSRAGNICTAVRSVTAPVECIVSSLEDSVGELSFGQRVLAWSDRRLPRCLSTWSQALSSETLYGVVLLMAAVSQGLPDTPPAPGLVRS